MFKLPQFIWTEINKESRPLIVAFMAGVRRRMKGERRAREAREDRIREDRGRGRLQGRYCFLYSAL